MRPPVLGVHFLFQGLLLARRGQSWVRGPPPRDGREQDVLEGSQESGCFGLKVFEQKHEKQDWRCGPGPITGLKGFNRSHTNI